MVARPSVTTAAYVGLHAALFTQAMAVHLRTGMFTTAEGERPDPKTASAMRARLRALLAADLRDAKAGLYPRGVLFQAPWRAYARALPELAGDLRGLAGRREEQQWRLPTDLDDGQRYPAYYRRQFHWQIDGYLSQRSAELYDVGVEVLFMGMADVMRRRTLPPIVREARGASRRLRVLDVACGTGRTLAMLNEAAPDLELTGLDLSRAYLDTAARMHPGLPVQWVSGNGEELPFRDNHFDVVTSTFLFHELPGAARRRVARELARVVRPGGLVVLEDSAQIADSPEIEPVLVSFPLNFHEPFYGEYLTDPLEDIVDGTGLTIEGGEAAWLSRTLVLRA